MGISIWQLLIVLLIVALLFGTRKLRNIGGDLGSAIKSFKSAMSSSEAEREGETNKKIGDAANNAAGGHVYDAEVHDKDKV